jgi:aspartate aminotransferase
MNRPTKSPPGISFDGVETASLSSLSRGLIGSEVLKIAAEVRVLLQSGQPVCNLTVGDFDPREFPPPPQLLAGIQRALAAGHTNYPPSNGVLELRQAIARFHSRVFGSTIRSSRSPARAARSMPRTRARRSGRTVAHPVPSWEQQSLRTRPRWGVPSR